MEAPEGVSGQELPKKDLVTDCVLRVVNVLSNWNTLLWYLKNSIVYNSNLILGVC